MPADDVPRLTWASKPRTVERVSLPFQVVETINESRATREAQRGSLFGLEPGAAEEGWHNKLIWGDNKLVLASLLREFGGQIDLIYIDPPFATGDDFSVKVRVGDTSLVKEPSILEEHAYRDTWGAGHSSYLSMMYERLALMRDLLSEEGSIYVHCDWRVNSLLRLVMDELFGRDCFQNEIAWCYREAINSAKRWNRKHDTLLFYSKSAERWTFNADEVLQPHSESTVKKYKYEDENGRYRLMGRGIVGSPIQSARDVSPEWEQTHPELVYRHYLRQGTYGVDYWNIDVINQASHERVGFATQKPATLLERIVKASSNRGDLVADFFVGSGTTAVVAESLGRRWVACDLGRFSIHTTRKRLLSTPGCAPFEILNLGAYERQHWLQATTGVEIDSYLGFILSLYEAERVSDYVHLHGKKGTRLIHVGAVDAPVTIEEIDQVMDELAANDLAAADVLGWEWEMGLHDVVGEAARRRGLDIACRQIPREVMKVEQGDLVRFFELAYLELQVDRQNRSVRVQLRDFVIPSDELIPESVRSKIDRWSDYIDYWSVDFNFRDDTFHNEWQAYRTRDEPVLAVESDWHDYEEAGRYAIVVKVIDIFGNDTTKLAEVVVK